MADQTGKPGSSRDKAAPRARTTKALTAALEHHRAGRLKEAEAIYRRVLEVQPRHADALHLLSVAAHHAGRPAEAIDLIGKAIAASGRGPGNGFSGWKSVWFVAFLACPAQSSKGSPSVEPKSTAPGREGA